MTGAVTYVFCLVAAHRPPALSARSGAGAGLGRPRLLDLGGDLRAEKDERRRVGTRRAMPLRKWLVVADAPVDRYGQQALSRRLGDLDWVARTAIAHEAVVESCMGVPAILPMKLLTIFTNDERARDRIRTDSARIDALIRRIAHHQEWGVRVMLDAGDAAASGRPGLRLSRGARRRASAVMDGRTYLERKKARHDAAREQGRHARDAVSGLYDRLAAQSELAVRRPLTVLPNQTAPLLLDAAFLVPLARAARFRSLVARQARPLASRGYRVMLTGPWPPYSFVESEG
jgi:hypothetical protein